MPSKGTKQVFSSDADQVERGALRRRGGGGVEERRGAEVVDVRQLALQLLGAMREAEAAEGRTFGELAEDWLSRLRRVQPANERRHLAHLEALASLREGQLTKAAIDAVFASLANKLGAATLNKLRSTGRLVIRDAQACGEWKGVNPFDLVKRSREPRRQYPRISAEELARALKCLREDRRRMAVVALHTGLRTGELLALHKVDVDLVGGFLHVHRSHGRDETKTGKPREVPLPEGCRTELELAIADSKSELVFPRPDGTRQRADTKLSRTLRTAFVDAGVVVGYRYVCRRKGCGFSDVGNQLEHRRCPTCDFTLLAVGLPKPFTWYDLRHAAATLHRQAGADPLAIKLALGHHVREVTDDIYTHLNDEDFRRELNRFDIRKSKHVERHQPVSEEVTDPELPR
jgi:integrase